MATASGKSEGTRKPVMPMAAYGVVLALLVAAGVVVFASGSGGGRDAGGSAGDAASRPVAGPTQADMRTARALKLPPRPPSLEKAAPEPPPGRSSSDKPDVETVAAPARPEPLSAPVAAPTSPPQADAEAEKKPEPPKSACKVDLARWPTDKSDQAQAVQMMLRDLGYYRGTTNGTVGPLTRTAIREFQAASGEAENGEIGEALFEALKKKCAAAP